MIYRNWQIKQIDENTVNNLKNELNVKDVLAKVLVSKGIKTKSQAQEKYLSANGLSNPYLMKDMDKATQRIRMAIENDEKIVIYGDYDVDGVCSVAVLFSYLENQGANVFYKIPHRENEGYGLNKDVLKFLKEKGFSLVITVDNGITAIDEVSYANSIGLDVVITDHHLPKDKLPDAIAVVDPLRKDDTSPCKTLAGVGVAFKLVCALEDAPCEEMLEFYSDLVCVGTVADLMILEGENRSIVKAGLELLNEDTRQGFKSLLKVHGYNIKAITSEVIAYTIAPRINASGRMSDATKALELLLEEDEEVADEIAMEIEKENQKRQDAQNKIAEQIILDISLDKSLIDDRVLVVWDENYHPGVIGIVASKLVEKYGKPAIVLTKDSEEFKGSGRSISSFSLHKALDYTKEYLLRFGGHTLAAGLSITSENLEIFKKAINEYANQNIKMASTDPLEIDCLLLPHQININSVKQIDYLAPFGNGNEAPVFAVKGAEIVGIFSIGDAKHIRVKFKMGDSFLQGVYFNKTQADFAYNIGDFVDVAFMLSIYSPDNGNEMVSIKIKDVAPFNMDEDIINQYDIYKVFKNKIDLTEKEKQSLLPTRDEIAKIYRYLQQNKVKNDDLRPLFVKFKEIPSGKIQVILDVLLEFQLIQISLSLAENYYMVVPNAEKKDLDKSEILKSLS